MVTTHSGPGAASPAATDDRGQEPGTDTALEARLRRLAGSVLDPELPVITLAELGVLRAVRLRGPGRVEVDLTPTYTGCPAVEAMSLDIERVLHAHGIPDVTVRSVLAPPGPPTTSPTKAAASSASSASPRPAPSVPRARSRSGSGRPGRRTRPPRPPPRPPWSR